MHDDGGVIRECGGGICEIVTRGGGLGKDDNVTSEGADKPFP